jgi:hypothetical protein
MDPKVREQQDMEQIVRIQNKHICIISAQLKNKNQCTPTASISSIQPRLSELFIKKVCTKGFKFPQNISLEEN